MTGRRVLVTGVSGFVGRHVVPPLLRAGFEVHGVSNGTDMSWADQGLHMHRADLLDPNAVNALIQSLRPSHLLHLAWTRSNARMSAVSDNIAWVRASLALFEAFRGCGGQRAVFAGSCAEYEWKDPLLVEESTPSRPRSIYGVCKNATREIALAASSAANVSTAWARLFFLFGPHEPMGRLVPDIASAVITGKAVELTSGVHERDYMYVEDAAEALASLLASEVTGTINVASGSCIRIKELALTLARMADGENLLEFGRRPLAAGEPPQLIGDTTRLRNELGFTPRHELQDALATTLRWWRGRLARSDEAAR